MTTTSRLIQGPVRVASKVHVGRAIAGDDDTTRIYLHANNAEMNRGEALALIASLAELVRLGVDR